jgi:hypothetical protein
LNFGGILDLQLILYCSIQSKENIEFINAEIDNERPDRFGEHHVVLLQNCLEELGDPVEFLALLKGCVELNGVLIISSTYNWLNALNQVLVSGIISGNVLFSGHLNDNKSFVWIFQPSDFSIPEVGSSFELLKFVLQNNFKFFDAKNIPEIICESTRSCRIQYNHVTAWIRINEADHSTPGKHV